MPARRRDARASPASLARASSLTLLALCVLAPGRVEATTTTTTTTTSDSGASLDCASVFPNVSVACCESLSPGNASSTGAGLVDRPLARMAYASGRSLPYDAGHFHACVHTPEASYYLLSWHLNAKEIPVAELGLCLPSACAKSDVEALVGAGRGGGDARATAEKADAAIANAENALRPFGSGYCAAAGKDANAAARCREYRAIMAAMDAADEIAKEMAEGGEGVGGGGGGVRGWYGAGAGASSVRLVVTAHVEDRVGFVRNATSGWACFALACVIALFVVVVVATALDASGFASRERRRGGGGGGVEEPLLSGRGDDEEGLGEGLSDISDDDPTAAATATRVERLTATLERVAASTNFLSLLRTFPKLIAAPSRPGPTDCLNGMRVLSMVWIIVGHTMMMPTPLNGWDNPEDLIARWGARGAAWFQVVVGGEIAVDTFFFLSGFLIAYLGVRDLEKRAGSIPVGGMIAHRWLRITPAFAFALVVYSQIASRIGDGPFFVRYQRSVFRRCDKLWWSELLYLHNFIPFDSDDVCMGWSWYLGNDFIFYLFSPFVLLLHHHRRRVMWAAIALTSIASCALTFWLVVHYGAGMYIFGESYVKYSYYAYSKPYCRVPAYLVGMAFGFVNESWASDPSKVPDFSRSQGASFLAAAFVALLACVFAPLSDYRDPESWPPWANGAFLSLVRPTWAAALGVLTTSCALGFTPTLNAFLAAPAWTPFARLTFGAYLFHPVAIKWFAGTATSTYHFSIHHVLSDAAFNAVCAFACAAVTWLVVERPTMSATSGLTSRRRAGA